jgi:perosamine synthetase
MGMLKAFARHSVNLSGQVFKKLFRIVKTNQVFKGPYIEEFEKIFAHYIGVKYAIGVSSARLGLYLVLKALGFNSGDEIIIPSYTFPVMPIVVRLCGLKPVFIDVQQDTYNIDTSLIEENIAEKTRAILATHLFGQPCKITRIVEIARRNNLKVIEDCAHAMGAEYKYRKVGSFGDAGIFSFGMGKNMPCFGGGMITTKDYSLFKKIKVLINDYSYPNRLSLWKNIFITSLLYFLTKQKIFPYTLYPIIRLLNLVNPGFLDGKLEEKVELFSEFPLQYQTRLTNLQAAVGNIQISQIDMINEKMRKNAEIFNEQFKGIKNIKISSMDMNTERVYTYYRIQVENPGLFRKRLLQRGIDTQKDDMSACSRLKIFTDSKNVCPISEKLPFRSIEIPNNPSLKEKDILYIITQIRNISSEML